MKKVLVGCGVIILIVIVLGGVLVYQAVQMGKTLAKGMGESRQQYEQVEAKFKFSAPADGILTADQLDKWLAVRKETMAASPEMKTFGQNQRGGNPFTAMQKMFEMISKVAQSHAAALTEHGMALSEYAWISRTVLGVLNSGDSRQNPKFKDLIAQIEAMQHEDKNRQKQAIPIWASAAPLTSQQIIKLTPIVEAKVPEMTETDRMFVVDAILIQQMPMLIRPQTGQTSGTTQAEAETTGTTGTTPAPAMSPAPAQ